MASGSSHWSRVKGSKSGGGSTIKPQTHASLRSQKGFAKAKAKFEAKGGHYRGKNNSPF